MKLKNNIKNCVGSVLDLKVSEISDDLSQDKNFYMGFFKAFEVSDCT